MPNIRPKGLPTVAKFFRFFNFTGGFWPMQMHFVAAAAAVKPSADVNSDGEIGDKGRIWLNLPFHLTPSEGKRTFMIGEVGKIGEGGCRRHLCQTFEPVLCKRYKLFYNLGAVQMMMLLLLLLLL